MKEAEECGLYILETADANGVDYSLPSDLSESLKQLYEKKGMEGFTGSQFSWIEEYTYTANGSVASVKNNFGTVYYEYDAENRLIHKHGGNTQSMGVKYEWTANGNLKSIQSASVLCEFTYNMMNRPVLIFTQDFKTGEKTFLRFEYDGLGRRITKENSSGNKYRFVYDGLTGKLLSEVPLFSNDSAVINYSQISAGSNSESFRYISGNEDNSDTSRKYRTADNESLTEYSSDKCIDRTFSVMDINGDFSAYLIPDENSVSSVSTEFILTGIIGSTIAAVTDSEGNCISYADYDEWGNQFGEGNIKGFSSSRNIISELPFLYSTESRDYSPQMKSFITKDPARDGENWFAYCPCDPVNFTDCSGLYKTGMSLKQKTDYMSGIAEVMQFDKKEYLNTGSSKGIPTVFDCADVAARVDELASKAAGLSDYSDMMNAFSADCQNGNYSSAKEKTSSDNYRASDSSMNLKKVAPGYNRDQLRFEKYKIEMQNIPSSAILPSDVKDEAGIAQYEYYNSVKEIAERDISRLEQEKKAAYDALRDPDVCTPGLVLAWEQTSPFLNNKNFNGHVLIVTARTFDNNGNVTGFSYMEGHTGGKKTAMGYISLENSSKCVSLSGGGGDDCFDTVDSWIGNYLGAFEVQRENYTAKKCKD